MDSAPFKDKWQCFMCSERWGEGTSRMLTKCNKCQWAPLSGVVITQHSSARAWPWTGGWKVLTLNEIPDEMAVKHVYNFFFSFFFSPLFTFYSFKDFQTVLWADKTKLMWQYWSKWQIYFLGRRFENRRLLQGRFSEDLTYHSKRCRAIFLGSGLSVPVGQLYD